jgi:hypothetical protein
MDLNNNTPKKNFLVLGAGIALSVWLFKNIIAGVVYATAVFFTNEKWKEWNKK